MAKEVNVTCDFLAKWLVCKLPEQTMDVLLKIRMKTRECTFREDVYTHTLKYCRWNNQLKPFSLLMRRVANIFRKRNSLPDDSRGTSTQTKVDHMDSKEERSVINSDKRNSAHSDWSDLISVDEEAEYREEYKTRKGPNAVGVATTLSASTAEAAVIPSASPAKKTVKNIVLEPYTPRANDWGSWQIRLPYGTSTVTSLYAVHKQVVQGEKEKDLGREEEEEGDLAYEPHSPYYSPVHPPKFYEDE